MVIQTEKILVLSVFKIFIIFSLELSLKKKIFLMQWFNFHSRLNLFISYIKYF